jgi:hypothetical protein
MNVHETNEEPHHTSHFSLITDLIMVALTSRTIQLLLLGLVIFANIVRNRFNAWVNPGEKNAGISSWMRHEELPPEVLGAEHYLVGLDIPDDIAEEGDYKGVQVSFCALNWAPQKAAPNTGK